MKTIYKYPLVTRDHQVILMPSGAKILSVQAQRDTLTIWALVDTDLHTVPVGIYVVGTGHDAGWMAPPMRPVYIGTAQTHSGALVWHVFVEGEDLS